MDALVTDVSDRPIATSPNGERYVVVSFQEAEGKVTGRRRALRSGRRCRQPRSR
jgi:hypothetical protein